MVKKRLNNKDALLSFANIHISNMSYWVVKIFFVFKVRSIPAKGYANTVESGWIRSFLFISQNDVGIKVRPSGGDTGFTETIPSTNVVFFIEDGGSSRNTLIAYPAEIIKLFRKMSNENHRKEKN